MKAAIADNVKPGDLHSPGHVFPLKARSSSVLGRRGHTEATVDLMQLAHLPEIVAFAERHDLSVLTVDDLVSYRSDVIRKAS